jgi:hypothetical protein
MLQKYRDVLLVFAVLVLAYAYFYQDPRWNGNTRMGLTFAMVREHQVTIDSYYKMPGMKTGDTSFYNGHYYADKAPGSSLLGVITFLPIHLFEQLRGEPINLGLLKHLMTLFTVSLPAAAAGTLLYLICRRISENRLLAMVAAVGVTLGSMLYPYGIAYYGHVLAAVFMVLSFWMIFRLRDQQNLPKPWYLILFGFVLGFGLITEFTVGAIALALVVYYLIITLRAQPKRWFSILAWPALGGIVPLIMLLIYNTLAFDSPFSLGYEHVENQEFQDGMSQGLMGITKPSLTILGYLTIHPAMGLFWQSPIALLSLAGIGFMIANRDYRREGILVLLIVVSYLLICSGYYMWWGGWAFGPRHIIPILPFLALPILFAPKIVRWLGLPLALLSIGQMMIVSGSDLHAPDKQIKQLAEIGFFEHSTIYDYCLPYLLKDEYVAWNLGRQVLNLTNWYSLIPLAVLIVCAFGLMAYWNRKQAEPVPQLVLDH